MKHQADSFVDHCAIGVVDMKWHIRFFKDVFGMDVREWNGDKDNMKQVWLHGGIQFNLCQDPVFCPAAHVAIRVKDMEKVLEKAYRYEGVEELPNGHNWFKVPEGCTIEVLETPVEQDGE